MSLFDPWAFFFLLTLLTDIYVYIVYQKDSKWFREENIINLLGMEIELGNRAFFFFILSSPRLSLVSAEKGFSV